MGSRYTLSENRDAGCWNLDFSFGGKDYTLEVITIHNSLDSIAFLEKEYLNENKTEWEFIHHSSEDDAEVLRAAATGDKWKKLTPGLAVLFGEAVQCWKQLKEIVNMECVE